MKLLLKVVSYAGNPPDSPLSITLDQENATIGRRAGNRWVLPDPARYVSGQHATIEYRTPNYYLTDTSVNGVGINGASLEKGHSQKLIEGDRLTMGEYVISVALISKPVEDQPDLLDKPTETGPSFSTNSFFHTESKSNSPDVVANVKSNELFSDWNENAQEETTDKQIPLDFPVFDSEQVHTSDLNLDNKPVSPLEEPFPADFLSPSIQPDFDDQVIDPKTPVKEEKQTKSKSGSPDVIANVKPDELFSDWDMNVDTQEGTTDKQVPLDFPALKSGPIHTPDSNPDNKSVSPLEEPFPADFLSPSIQPDFDDQVIDPKTPVKKEKQERQQTDSSKAEIKSSQGLANTHLLHSFIQGAGLTNEDISHAFTPENFYEAGQIFRISVQGMMDVLAARANIKNEMHMDATVFGSTRNNPIKDLHRHVNEVMISLLSTENVGYMPPKQAIEETFDDIKAHQLAVFAGVQTALKSVLQRFNPDKLEQRLQKQNPIGSIIPIHKQAKLWGLFEALYDKIESEAEDDFHKLFGQAFAQAYEKQVEQLQRVKKESPISSPRTK